MALKTWSPRTVQAIATGAGSALLIALVTFTVSLLVRGESFLPTAVAANAFAGPLAVAAWSGALFRRKGGGLNWRPESWMDWIGIFLVSSVMSALFLFIDCGHHLPSAFGGTECNGHPGISAVFTAAALTMTVIALPGALRAWLLEVLSKPAETRA
jgi:membrane protease YdiL (CAAX protease family)